MPNFDGPEQRTAFLAESSDREQAQIDLEQQLADEAYESFTDDLCRELRDIMGGAQ